MPGEWRRKPLQIDSKATPITATPGPPGIRLVDLGLIETPSFRFDLTTRITW